MKDRQLQSKKDAEATPGREIPGRQKSTISDYRSDVSFPKSKGSL